MAEHTNVAPMWGRAPLPLPSVGSLTAEQQRGADCVWCKTTLTAETAVDLGERRIRALGRHVSTFPRGCRPCTRTYAYRALLEHAPFCEQCADNESRCDTGRTLRALIREGCR